MTATQFAAPRALRLARILGIDVPVATALIDAVAVGRDELELPDVGASDQRWARLCSAM